MKVHHYGEEFSNNIEKKIFFAINPDYKEYELDESNDLSGKLPEKHPIKKHNVIKTSSRLTKLWENGGPISLYSPPGDGSFTLTFCNYENLEYNSLDTFFKQFGRYESIRELSGNFVRVRYKKEEEIRNCYIALKMDPKHEVAVLLDVDKYFMEEKKKKRGFMRKNECFSGLNVSDNSKTANNFENALAREALIKFVHSDLRSRTNTNTNFIKKENSHEQSGIRRIGFWKGNIVVEPEEPYVNKYLKPPTFCLDNKKKVFANKNSLRDTAFSRSEAYTECFGKKQSSLSSNSTNSSCKDTNESNYSHTLQRSKHLLHEVSRNSIDSGETDCNGSYDSDHSVWTSSGDDTSRNRCSKTSLKGSNSLLQCHSAQRGEFNYGSKLPIVCKEIPASDALKMEPGYSTLNSTSSPNISSLYSNSTPESKHPFIESMNLRLHSERQDLTDKKEPFEKVKSKSLKCEKKDVTLKIRPKTFNISYNKSNMINSCFQNRLFQPTVKKPYEFLESSTSSPSNSDDIAWFSLENSLLEEDMLCQDTKTSEEFQKCLPVVRRFSSETREKFQDTPNCLNSDNQIPVDHNWQSSSCGPVHLAKNTYKGPSQCSYDNSNAERMFEDMPPLISIFDLYAMWLRRSVLQNF